jgi:hypothetical protein
MVSKPLAGLMISLGIKNYPSYIGDYNNPILWGIPFLTNQD